MEILDEQPTEEASQMEYQSNNESLHFHDSNIITVGESSNHNNVNDSSNDKSDVFQSKGKNLPPKLAEIKQNTSELLILTQTIAIAIRHKLTHEATVSILKLLISIMNNSNLPSTKKNLWEELLTREPREVSASDFDETEIC